MPIKTTAGFAVWSQPPKEETDAPQERGTDGLLKEKSRALLRWKDGGE